MNWIKRVVLVCLMGSVMNVVGAYGFAERLPAWDAGVRGGIPDVSVVVEVDATELEARGTEVIQSAIDAVAGRGAVLLPAGEFRLREPIHLRDGVVLRGRGADMTELTFDIPPPEEDGTLVRPAYGAVRMAGKRGEAEIRILDGHGKGSQVLSVEAGHGLEPGDTILVFSENDPELMYSEARWNVSWALQSLAQIVKVTDVETERVHIDVPLRLDYKAELSPRIQRIRPVEWAGVEDLTLLGAEGFDDSIIGIEAAENCWVRGVDSGYTGRGHIWINFSRFVTVTGNECHHAYDYGGGGNGYGIVAGNVATDCLITDNLLHNLRHSLMTKRGSNGNVFAYNYSTQRRREPAGRPLLCDISVHGHYSYANLFEGNVVEFVELADYWGPTGPQTTLFRNRVIEKLEVRDHSHWTNLIGNDVLGGEILVDDTCEHVLQLGNREGGGEACCSEPKLPASLCFTERPPFWTDLPWPAIGPGTDSGREVFIPAQARLAE
jgi:hypothetical protein